MKKLLFIIFASLLFNTSNARAEDIDIFTAVANLKYDDMETFVKDIDLSKVKQTLEQKDKVKAVPNFTNEFFANTVMFTKDAEIVEYFLNKAGADINYKDKYRDIPLVYAIQYNKNPDIVKMLIKAGSNINNKNQFGRSAIFYSKSVEIASALVKARADINIKDNEGRSPLLHALKYTPNLDIARYLIEAGADVKAKDNNGNTALIYLFDREPKVDAPDIVQKLIDGGVDVNDYDLKNPLEYAHVCKLKKSEKILIKAGAKMKKENSPERLERIDFNCEKYSTYSWADIQINLH